MKTACHLEMDQFLDTVMNTKSTLQKQVIVLDCCVAGIVYGFLHEGIYYYLDRFYPTMEKENVVQRLSFYDLHAEMYRKINLKLYCSHFA